MTRIMFICHGNICRSPMAEFIMKKLIRERGLEDVIEVASCATSAEELGSPVYPEAAAYLKRIGIDPRGKRAVRVTRSDLEAYDLLVAMERYNVNNLRRSFGRLPEEKVRLLGEFTRKGGDIEDPWYSGNFEKVGDQIREGCEGLLNALLEEGTGTGQ